MKKAIIIVAYWLAVIFLTSILLTSLDYNMGEAVLMSLSFLPASLALCFFLPFEIGPFDYQWDQWSKARGTSD